MASIKEGQTKTGKRFYEIRVRRGRGMPTLSRRWYVPDGWSSRAIDRELKKVAAEFERQAEQGEIISRVEKTEREAKAQEEAAKILTFRQYAERIYLPSLTVTASPHTVDNFQRNLKNHIYPAIGEKKMPDVSTADITALLLKAQETHKLSSVLKLYTIVNLIFKKAYHEDMIKKNPMDRVTRPKPKKEEGKNGTVEAYTAEELARFMDLIEGEPLQWRCYISLLIDCGCRRGEACGLRWCDVDLDNGTIQIEHTLAYTPKAGVYLDSPKNGKTRKVFVDKDVLSMLKELRDSQKVVKKDGTGYVFTQGPNSLEPMFPDAPTRYFQKLGERLGIEGLHPHKLRHTFASIAITNGADPVSIAQTLGHSDVAVTLRIYSHANEESQRKASSIFRTAIKEAAKEKNGSGT